VAGVVIVDAALTDVGGADPVTAGAGRIGIVTGEPDVAPMLPLIVSGDPDRAAIGAVPGMFYRGWGRALRPNLEVNG
jgi:hypothetical protein